MLNRVIMIGRLTRDPELRKTPSSLSVASFTIACDDNRKGPNGEKQTVFMNCSLFGQTAEFAGKYARKGNLVAIQGRITQRKYVRRTDNVQITATDIIADDFQLLEPKGNNTATTNDNNGYAADVPAPSAPIAQTQNSDGLDSIDVVDDDLPF